MTDFTAYLRLGVDSRDAVTAQKNLNNMAGAADKADRSFSVLGAASKVLGAALGAVGAGKVAGDLIEVSRQTGILRAGLETATGSAEDAQESFKAIAQLATQLPESVNDVTTAFTKLVNYGLDPSQAAIKSYSNTASALGKDLTQMIEAVADAATGEFERLKEFGIKSKKEGDNVSFTFRGVTTTVKNSAEEIEGYLQGLGNVQFAGAAEKQMASLDGAISNLGDSYDGLLRSISDAGAGDFIASSIRSVSDAMGEITAMIESGQLGALFDAYIGKFQGFMDAGVTAFEIVSIAWKDLSSGIDGNVITDAFVNMPENIKAFVQIAVVELATLYDKAKIYLNPKNWVGDQSFDEMLSGINMAREESITQILAEREAAIKSFDDQVTAANDLRAGYDLASKSVVDLGQYAIKAGEQSASSMQSATKEAEKYADAVSKIQQAEFGDFDRALGAENKQWEDLEKQQKTFDSLIKSVDDFGGAWSRTGSIVADALGSMVDGLDDYMSKMDSLAQAEADVAEARKIANNPKQIEAAEKAATKLSKERTKTEIASYRSIAGAAATMFKENSKGRKALHAIEKTLAAIELAMAIKNTATELSLSATRTAATTAETGVNVAAGAAKFFAQSGWAGFVGVAAMVAAMAALGYSSGGGGGGGPSAEDLQESQGTGSVLGSDEKSESIANSMELFTDIGVDQLSELRGIRSAMAGLSNGIAQLAISFVAGNRFSGADATGIGTSYSMKTGDLGIAGSIVNGLGGGDRLQKALGDIFGTTKKKVVDSGLQFGSQDLGEILGGQLEADYYNTIETTKKKLWGLSKKKSTSDQLTGVDSAVSDELTRIFSFMADAVDASVSSLGIASSKSINDFVVSIGKVSFKDLSGEEIQSELEAIFSQQADLMAEFLMPEITMYQQMGEGAFETLTRVAREQAIFNDAIDAMGVSLGDVSAIIRIDVAQAIIDLTGGLENFTDLAATYADKFLSDAEKLEILGSSLGDVYGEFGLSIPKTRDEFKALVSAQDLTTESGQKLFAALLEVAGATDEYLSMLEDQREEMVNASFSALQRSVNAEKAIIAEQVAILNTALSASKATYNALESSLAGMVISSNQTLAATRANAQSQLQGFLRSAQAGNIPSADDLKGALSVISQPSQKLFGTFEEFALDAARTAATIKELQDITGDQISSEEKALQELKDQSTYLDEMVTFAKEQIDILNGVDNSVISLVDAMNNFASTIGVQLPTIQQLTPEQLSSMNTKSNETVAAKIEQVSVKQQQDFKKHSDIMEASQIAIVENSLAIRKLIEKFDAIGMPPVREE